MKTRRIILSSLSLLVLIFCLTVPLAGYAAEQPTSTQDSKAQTNTTSSAHVTKLVNKAEKAKTTLLDVGKAYSFPLIFYSFIGGAVLLVVGVILGLANSRMGDSVKGTGIALIVLGSVAFVLINFAPNIAEMIMVIAKGFFS